MGKAFRVFGLSAFVMFSVGCEYFGIHEGPEETPLPIVAPGLEMDGYYRGCLTPSGSVRAVNRDDEPELSIPEDCLIDFRLKEHVVVREPSVVTVDLYVREHVQYARVTIEGNVQVMALDPWTDENKEVAVVVSSCNVFSILYNGFEIQAQIRNRRLRIETDLLGWIVLGYTPRPSQGDNDSADDDSAGDDDSSCP